MCFQIKTQQVLGEFLKILPRAPGKRQHLSLTCLDFNAADDDPRACSELLLYNSIAQVLEPVGSPGCTRVQI